MRAERRKPSSSGQAIVLLAVLGLAVPAALTFLDAATQEREVPTAAGSEAGEQHASERGRALGHERRCPPEGSSAGAVRGNFKRARKQQVFFPDGCRPNATFGNAALAAREVDTTGRDELVAVEPAEPTADGQRPSAAPHELRS